MIATAKTPGGLFVPLQLNPFEFRRRLEEWKKSRKKLVALQALKDAKDENARRGSYMLRNFGADKVAEMNRIAIEERRSRERKEAERIADMMAMEAADAFKKGLI